MPIPAAAKGETQFNDQASIGCGCQSRISELPTYRNIFSQSLHRVKRALFRYLYTTAKSKFGCKNLPKMTVLIPMPAGYAELAKLF
jgi:hypothetical protein